MRPVIDLFFSFRSPYSYLATPGALEVLSNFDVDINFRPVLPQAVRNPDFFDPKGLYKVKYILMDWQRRAEMLDMAHAWPSPDPIVQDLKTFKVAQEQPYIYRLVWLGVEANRRGKGLQFAKEVSHVIFGGTKDWDEGDHLKLAAARAGLDLASMEESIKDPTSHIAEVEGNHVALEESGHTGVPNFVYGGKPFFGQDRIDSLCYQLKKDGLEK